MTGPQPKNHEVDLATAAAMTGRHRAMVTVQGARTPEEGSLGGMFSRDAILKLLDTPGATYLRFYYGRNSKGGRELILVAADADGNDMLDGDTALDTHWPCPPVCTLKASALRG